MEITLSDEAVETMVWSVRYRKSVIVQAARMGMKDERIPRQLLFIDALVKELELNGIEVKP